MVIGQANSAVALQIYALNNYAGFDMGVIQALDKTSPGVVHRDLDLQPNGDNVGIGTTDNAKASLDVEGKNGVVLNAGNVGIGTWAPGAPVQLNAVVTAYGQPLMEFTDSTAPGSFMMIGEGTSNSNSYQPLLRGESTTYFGNGLALQGQISAGMDGIGNPQEAAMLIDVERIGDTPIQAANLFSFDNNDVSVMMINKNGNIGIGTFNPFAGGLIVTNGNVGIGTLVPGQLLDVKGTARMTGFNLTGNGAGAGNVLVGNGIGVGTWMAASTLGVTGASGTNFWLNDTGNIGISTAYAVGIGTISQINKLNILGNIGIGTFSYDPYMKTSAPSGGMIISGNVGIGTWVPAMEVDIEAQGQGLDIMQVGDALGTYFLVSGYGNKAGIETGNIQAIDGITLSITNGAGSGSAGTQFFHQSNPDSYTSGTGQLVQLYGDTGDGQFNPSSGNGVYNMLEVDPNINQTGTATGITRAIFINPNNPASYDFRALETSIGNVGIGTISGNLGIGSQWPGQRLDINGAARMKGFALTGNGAGNGNVLVSNLVGIGTWMSTTTLPVATVTVETPGDVAYYSTTNGFAGGTGFQTNGTNVGIGTSNFTNASLQIVGNIGIGTVANGDKFITSLPPNGGMIVEGNVGIGSAAPGQLLDVQGTVRVLGEIVNGNVGIGTYKENAGLSVMNGNVGIGTWNPRATLDVEGTLSTTSFAGNVGVGTLVASNLLTVNGNMVANGSILTNPNGSTAAAPRLFGFSPAFTTGQAAQIQFGDNNNIIQNGYGDRMQLSAYWGIEIHGDFQGVAGGFVTGVASDASLTVFAPTTANNNILSLVNNAGTTTYDVVGSTGNLGIGTTITSSAMSVMSGNVGVGTWVPNNKFEVKGGNVGIGTILGGAMVTLGGSCAAHQGTGVCFGASSTGVTCLGYCTAGAWPNCTTCNCC